MFQRGIHRAGGAALVALCIAMTSCWGEVDCDRPGCARLAVAAYGYEITTGIAGAAATESDVVQNDCQECLFADGTLKVLPSIDPITTQEEAQALIDQAAIIQTMEFHNYYEWELTAGEFLVCEGSDTATCLGVTLEEGEVMTVHIKFVNGPPQLIVYLPGETEPADYDRIFEVQMP